MSGHTHRCQSGRFLWAWTLSSSVRAEGHRQQPTPGPRPAHGRPPAPGAPSVPPCCPVHTSAPEATTGCRDESLSSRPVSVSAPASASPPDAPLPVDSQAVAGTPAGLASSPGTKASTCRGGRRLLTGLPAVGVADRLGGGGDDRTCFPGKDRQRSGKERGPRHPGGVCPCSEPEAL